MPIGLQPQHLALCVLIYGVLCAAGFAFERWGPKHDEIPRA
jgi:hypothetical protein